MKNREFTDMAKPVKKGLVEYTYVAGLLFADYFPVVRNHRIGEYQYTFQHFDGLIRVMYLTMTGYQAYFKKVAAAISYMPFFWKTKILY